jgi:hypothetical protein
LGPVHLTYRLRKSDSYSTRRRRSSSRRRRRRRGRRRRRRRRIRRIKTSCRLSDICLSAGRHIHQAMRPNINTENRENL